MIFLDFIGVEGGCLGSLQRTKATSSIEESALLAGRAGSFKERLSKREASSH